MKVTFVPSVCKPQEDGSPQLYEGTVTMRMPTYDERLALYEEADIDVDDDDDNDDEKTKREKKKKRLRMMRAIARLAKDFVVAVELKRLSDGFVLSSWEHLSYESDASSVIQEVAGRLIGKFSVGVPQ
jgi:hypothetical protein